MFSCFSLVEWRLSRGSCSQHQVLVVAVVVIVVVVYEVSEGDVDVG